MEKDSLLEGLTPRQVRFIENYLLHLNGKRAAIEAGYSPATAEVQASRLLRHAQVKAAIDAAKVERAERVGVEADEVLRELKLIGTADPALTQDDEGNILPLHLMPAAIRRAIASIDVEERWENVSEGNETRMAHVANIKKIKFWPKDRALELLGKHLKMYTDKLELTGKVTLEQLVEESYPKTPEAEEEGEE